jgi:hypothetical protein
MFFENKDFWMVISIMFSSVDDELARAYLGIWLAPGGLSDSLRDRLLN